MWIARIMITWGILAGLTAFVAGPTASASCASCWAWPRPGSSPGMMLYFTYWFPA